MNIARYERKELLRYGAQKEIAEALGVDKAVVSKVMNDKPGRISDATIRLVRSAIAKELRMPVRKAFPL